ncbi:MAG: PD40 domain-containing protein [Anaerolineaceae bacterium]|nr:PD40 domain-containing protein [Anaerolineaceae bacterium]
MLKLSRLLFGLLLVTLLPGIVQAQDDDPLSALPGTIAYLGVDGNVYSIGFDANTQVILTDDGNTRLPYLLPTWSTDGRLAYFRMRSVNGLPATEIFVSRDGISGGDLAYTATNEAVNYAYWSPRDCDEGVGCRDLAVLMSSRTEAGLFIRLVRDTLEEDTTSVTDAGQPFYYSWSPDGTRMLWQRNQRRLDIYDAQRGVVVDTLTSSPGVFQSPGWSPVDDRWLVGVLAENDLSTNLVVATIDDQRVLVSDLVGPIAFSWSPDGNYIAYNDHDGPLAVLDAVTGQIVGRSDVSGVFAFFWSPDSKHIAFLTLASTPNVLNTELVSGSFQASPAGVQQAAELAWSVLDIESGAVRRYGFFFPTRQMLYFVTFFDQFSQSHRVWSPDSRFIVYSEVQGNTSLLNVIDVSQENVVPVSVAEGVFGVWSFN